MYTEIINILSKGAKKKENLYNKSISRYIIAAMIAGVFIGIGTLTMGLSNMIFKDVLLPIVKFVNGFVFSLALSLVMTSGGELFTGNILVFTMRSLKKEILPTKAAKICGLSYLGNFLGAIFLSLLFLGAEGFMTPFVDSVVKLAMTKASYSISSLFFKGILCNILVCLGVLAYNKLENEAAKLIMIFWCILPFVAMGFEHSVANMTCFTIAKIVSKEFTFALMFKNLIPVTLGNIVGGSIVAISYFVVGKEDEKVSN